MPYEATGATKDVHKNLKNAKLCDGMSRNPSDRDKLIEQRTKKMQGIIGQVRGFNLDEFLSDYEEPGTISPWALGNNGWVPEDNTKKPQGTSQAGITCSGTEPLAVAVAAAAA